MVIDDIIQQSNTAVSNNTMSWAPLAGTAIAALIVMAILIAITLVIVALRKKM